MLIAFTAKQIPPNPARCRQIPLGVTHTVAGNGQLLLKLDSVVGQLEHLHERLHLVLLPLRQRNVDDIAHVLGEAHDHGYGIIEGFALHRELLQRCDVMRIVFFVVVVLILAVEAKPGRAVVVYKIPVVVTSSALVQL